MSNDPAKVRAYYVHRTAGAILSPRRFDARRRPRLTIAARFLLTLIAIAVACTLAAAIF